MVTGLNNLSGVQMDEITRLVIQVNKHEAKVKREQERLKTAKDRLCAARVKATLKIFRGKSFVFYTDDISTNPRLNGETSFNRECKKIWGDYSGYVNFIPHVSLTVSSIFGNDLAFTNKDEMRKVIAKYSLKVIEATSPID